MGHHAVRHAVTLVCLSLICSCRPTEPADPIATSAITGSVLPQRIGQPWYEAEIRAFEQADLRQPPAAGQVLFVGSSSIRLWQSLPQDVAPLPVLARGFGGAKTGDVLEVMDRIVLPYHPGAIVYYCGENDLGESNTDSAAAAAGFFEFCERVHGRLPGTQIYYLSMKPSPARWANWDAIDRGNSIVAAYARDADRVDFIDVSSCLLGPDGRPSPECYAEDGLHLSHEGYARWAAIIRERVATP